jgi:hypothetical protein
VVFDVTDQLLTPPMFFLLHSSDIGGKNGSKMGQYNSNLKTSRKLMIQLGGSTAQYFH